MTRPAKFWLKALNVYPSEWLVVKRLYLLQFFQGAGIAFFFTAAFAQFLERFPITQLPWAMVISSVLLWAVGFLYARLEHALSFKKFHASALFFSTASMLLFWLLEFNENGDTFYYILIAWFSVLYLVDNLGFWGIATHLFDVRQSKRLFGVISAGDIPAKFFGYTLALILVPHTGTQSLILIGAACMLLSLPFLFAISKSMKHVSHSHAHDHGHNPGSARPKKIAKLVSNFVTNGYIRRIAIISLITSCCLILFNYGFYGEVAKAFKQDVQLASFIAFFYASVRILAFITKMIFTSRVTAALGVKTALFITPVAMILLTGSIIIISNFSVDTRLIFYVFGVASILTEVLRTAFNTPVLLTLMQPLPLHERLRAHNIVKGIMDPFAFLCSGTLLLILFSLHEKVDLVFLCYALLALGLLWIVGVVLVNRRYVNILVDTISSRFFSRDEFDLNDEAVMNQIRNKMTTGSELEVISILNMLNSKRIDNIAEELIFELLKHPSDRVKIETIHMVGSRRFTKARQSLEELLALDNTPEVKAEAIKAYCRIGDKDWNIWQYLNHHESSIREAGIVGMLGNTDDQIRSSAENSLTELLDSHSEENKRKAINILQEVKDFYSHPGIERLIDDESNEIPGLAIRSIGRASEAEVLRKLFRHIDKHEKAVLEAFYNAGHKSIFLIHEQLQSGKLDPELQEKLINVLGKTGGEKATEALVDLLKSNRNTSAIVRALHRCKYSADSESHKELESIARRYIVYAVELLYMQKALQKGSEEYHVITSSLNYEIQNIQEILLALFGCMYDRQKMNQVRYGLSGKGGESSANAMEIIEVTVKKDIGRLFNTLFEPATIDQRCEALQNLYTKGGFGEVDEVLNRILSEKPIDYYSWTKACSMYISKKHFRAVDHRLFHKFTESRNILLRETALFADSKIVT
jgi:AAA family ATP:ADP antiporter